MNVASLELCKELYELSKWGFDAYDKQDSNLSWYREYSDKGIGNLIAPKYEAGYLLRKLPINTQLYRGNQNSWWCICTAQTKKNTVPKRFGGEYDTPENALCKLAIELFKQEILVKD